MVDEQELPRLYLRFARANELLTLRLSEDKGGDILKEAGSGSEQRGTRISRKRGLPTAW